MAPLSQPVKHGDRVQMSCERKHVNRGCGKSQMIATCQDGTLKLPDQCLTECVKTGTWIQGGIKLTSHQVKLLHHYHPQVGFV